MSKYLPTLLKLLIILAVAVGFGAFWYFITLPDRLDAQQTIVIGPNRFAPNSQAGLRVVVQEAGSGQPVPQAQVKVSLEPKGGGQAQTVFEGQTDASGSLPLSFQVPAEAAGDYDLVVETESGNGSDRLAQPVVVERDYRLLLTTDKPLYQPGQVIHMRALALSRLDLSPAQQSQVEFIVQDAKGNKVFRKSIPTSAYGIAAADFTLADMVNQGDYKLIASLGNTTSEKTVEVKPYVLPKFGVTVTTDHSFYSPGQRVEGSVQADYFFGKPVANSQVQLTGLVYDIERVELVNLAGQTDAQGRYAFSFDLPPYFAGSGLDSQQAQFALEVTVIDQADHAEQTGALLPIASQPIVIEAVPESGDLRPGVENIVYILTAYPDGSPAQTTLAVKAGPSNTISQTPVETLTTNEYGLAEFRLTPGISWSDAALDVQARDETGLSAARLIPLQPEAEPDHVLLRADRATYLVGETVNLTALTPVNSGSIYLDIVKEGQTLSTRSAPVENGRADFAIDLSPDLYGTLELHAYKVLLDGRLVRDSRIVVVDQPRDLAITASADKDTYLPGETATLTLQTTTAQAGEPVQTALGLAIVDESVFALERQDPGFAKLYFMLEAELMQPFYQIKGFELPATYAPDQDNLRQAQDASAKAAWVEAPTAGLTLQANSRPEKIQMAHQAQQAGLLNLGIAAILGMSLIPLLMAVLVVRRLRRDRQIKRALWGLLKVIGILILILIGLYALLFLLSSFYIYLGWYFYNIEPYLFVLGALAGLILLGLGIYGWRRGDETAKFLVLLSAAWVALLILLVNTADYGTNPPEILAIPLLISFVLLPVAYLLFGQKLWAEDRTFPGWLATIVGGFTGLVALLMVFLALFSFAYIGGGGGMAMAPVAPQPEMMAVEAVDGVRLVEVEKEVVMEAAVEDKAGAPETGAQAEPPRLRQFFPETLYWNPEVITDQNGQARLEIPMADSITTWRLTALASSADGRLGFTSQGLRVFQDFFVDVDLPVALTQGDQISIPVGVFNYLTEAQEVRLEVKPEPWFELLGETEQTLTIAANEIDVVYFPIRVNTAVDSDLSSLGRQGFQVTAWGAKMSDAVRREVRVLPNGKEIRQTQSDWLRENKEISLDIPPEIIPRTAQVEVKIYTGVLAQVVEGLEKILRLPHG
jgi:5-hydroxyisourate hydrolase-like protein (transthyretin family)